MDTFQFAPGFPQTQICQQTTLKQTPLRKGDTAAGVVSPLPRLLVNRNDLMAKRLTTDSGMRLAGNANPDAYYEPNSFNAPVQDERFREPPLKISGDADRYSHRDGNDDYRQPGDLFRLMTVDQKKQLFQNYKAAMEGVPVEIVKRQIVHCYRADHEYGAGVAKAMGIDFTPQTVAAE